MKILNRKDFLALPKGVLYSNYNEYTREVYELHIKDETSVSPEGVDDWVFLDLGGSPTDYNYYPSSEQRGKEHRDSLKNGTSFDFEYDGYERDGNYNEEEFFAVYEKEDLTKLIDLLGGLIGCYPSI